MDRPTTGRAAVFSAIAIAAVVLLSACTNEAAESQQLLVFTAASLSEVFEDMANDFELAHPDVDIRLATGGSDQLARSIADGASADIFASADERQMEVVRDAGLVIDTKTFAMNRLALVVAPGNPFGITGLEDLDDPRLLVVIAAETVPIGVYTRQALDEAGITLNPVSLEPDTRAVLTKVRLGEADAGVVYHTDVAVGGDEVQGIDITQPIEAQYSIAIIGRPNPTARSFVDYVTSPAGQAVLHGRGFETP